MASVTADMDTQPDDLLKYRQMQKKFRHACRQVVLLNNKIADVQLRYDRAVRTNKRSWRYVTRLNLASIEGVRNMFYEYACRKADELDQMQDRLINAGMNLDNWSMEDDSGDEETDAVGREIHDGQESRTPDGDTENLSVTSDTENDIEPAEELMISISQGDHEEVDVVDDAPDIGARQ